MKRLEEAQQVGVEVATVKVAREENFMFAVC
jgi:hypothetical protein